MGLDLWFRADVQRILRAVDEAMQATAAVMGDGALDSERVAGYRQGFSAALLAVSTAFGLTGREPETTYRHIDARVIQE